MAKEFSLGLVEVSGLGHAIIMLDDMLKAGDVEFVATERKLGGRLVTIVVRGEIAAVKASVDAGVARARMCGDGIYKASQVIARPHPEIFPYLHLNEDEEETPEVNTESAATHVGSVGQKAEIATTRKRSTTKAAPKKTAAKRTGSSGGKKKTAAKKEN